jgi:hypothetical protein
MCARRRSCRRLPRHHLQQQPAAKQGSSGLLVQVVVQLVAGPWLPRHQHLLVPLVVGPAAMTRCVALQQHHHHHHQQQLLVVVVLRAAL